MDKERYTDAVCRAAPPQVLFAQDVALLLQVDLDEAERLLLTGECGPVFAIGCRPAVLRESLFAALREKGRNPERGEGES